MTEVNEVVVPARIPLKVRKLLRNPFKPLLREVICQAVDCFDAFRGLRHPLLPPCRLRVRIGCFFSFLKVGEYRTIAHQFAVLLQSLVSVKPTTRFLDIGCGCGPLAIEMAEVLSSAGRYEGFDPDAEAIDWCRGHISAVYLNFQFTQADVANTLYNPGGVVDPIAFRFPYVDKGFDVIVLKSVFTHMRRSAMSTYLAEIRRMLAPGGRCVASFFLLDAVTRQAMREGKSRFEFPYEFEGCLIADRMVPEYLIAYDEQDITGMVRAVGLEVEAIHFGSWSGRADFLSFQDLLVLKSGDHGQ